MHARRLCDGPAVRDAPPLTERLADEDDDARLRRRVGIVAGFLTVLAPLSLPIQAGWTPITWLLAVGLSAFAIANLLVLWRTQRFERYLVALIAVGTVFVPLATLVGGGITGSSTGLVWGFLGPAYAIMALGPGRATAWFLAYLAIVALMVVVDPLVHEAIGEAPYTARLIGLVQNSLTPLAITFLLLRYTDVRRRVAEARVDDLLTNAIPRTIANRLKRGEHRIAEAYPATTVLFADLVGFTPWAQRTPPERVVALLDALFTQLDELTEQHGLEKIKTIGDAYMAVAGAPAPRADHADAAINLGRAVLRAVAGWRDEHGLELDARVGLASGPVVAGVIGRRRVSFDLWGDTVNLAARMESSAVPGRIQVAPSTRELLGDRYSFEPRDVDVKGLGPVRAFLLRDAGQGA